jgi:anti-sigma regulatory factor (Ser/Thr protein kinase)
LPAWSVVISDLGSIPTARKAFRRLLGSFEAAPLDVGAAESVFGELLANAFMHGDAGDVEVQASSVSKGVRLSVTSRGRAFAFAPQSPGPLECGGRGFQIIAALATDISVERQTPFNTVTVTIRLSTRQFGHLSRDGDIGPKASSR